jgi:outer membrane protein
MRNLKKYMLLVAVSAIAYSYKAQEAKSNSFSLQQAIEYAMKNSPNILNAELDLKNAEYRKKEITGTGLPQLSGSIDIKDYINIPTSLLPGIIIGQPDIAYVPVQFGTKYNATAGFSASQLLFSSDYIFGLKAAEQFLNLSKISITRSKSDLVAQVSKAYYAVLIANERLKLLDVNVIRLKKILDDTRAYNKSGFVELIDVERLEVQYNNLVSEKEKTVRLIGLAENTLKFQMSYKLSDSINLTDVINVNNEATDDLSAAKVDVSRRSDFQLLQAQQSLLDIDVKRQKWGYLPSLVAYASHNYNAQRSTFNLLQFDNNDLNKKWFKITLIGATLNMNIFTGMQRVNRLQQAKIAAQKNQNTLKNAELGAEMEASVASTSYINAVTTLKMQKKNMELAQHVYDVIQKKFESGIGNNQEIVNADASLKEAQTNYYSAVYDMIVSKIDYQKATGTLVK